MRPMVSALLAALGPSPWLPVNQLANSFQIGLAAHISSGASLTYSVQHTFDDPGQDLRLVSISRTTTTATVTDTAHGLSVGDNILVSGTGSSNLDGSYDVASVVDANTYTYTVANTGAAAGGVNSKLQSFRVFNHATMSVQTGRLDGNYAFPIQACRIKVTTYSSGNVQLIALQGAG